MNKPPLQGAFRYATHAALLVLDYTHLTGHSTYKGALYLHVIGRSYVVNLGASQVQSFLYSARSPR